MNIQIMNSNKNERYNFEVDNTTTMKDIKEQYAQQLDLEVSKLRVWISSYICPIIKKEWPSNFDDITLFNCHILKPEARSFIIIKSL